MCVSLHRQVAFVKEHYFDWAVYQKSPLTCANSLLMHLQVRLLLNALEHVRFEILCVAVCQCVAVCCSVVQCVAKCCGVL